MQNEKSCWKSLYIAKLDCSNLNQELYLFRVHGQSWGVWGVVELFVQYSYKLSSRIYVSFVCFILLVKFFLCNPILANIV